MKATALPQMEDNKPPFFMLLLNFYNTSPQKNIPKQSSFFNGSPVEKAAIPVASEKSRKGGRKILRVKTEGSNLLQQPNGYSGLRESYDTVKNLLNFCPNPSREKAGNTPQNSTENPLKKQSSLSPQKNQEWSQKKILKAHSFQEPS